MIPDISIIVLNFNREKLLDRSIRSCCDQILFNKKKEIIFLDDGSTDDSIKLIKSMKIKDLKIIRNKKNMGIGYSANKAVKNAKGEFFIRVDSDDYISKFACEAMSNILIENPQLAYVYCDHFRVNANGFVLGRQILNTKSKIRNHGAGIMFRTKYVKEVGNYNKRLEICEDFELIKQLDKKYKSFYLPLSLYRYFQHAENISNKGGRAKIIRKINKKI